MLKFLFTLLCFSFLFSGFSQSSRIPPSQTSRIAASSGLTDGVLPVKLPLTNIGNIGRPFSEQNFHFGDDKGEIEGTPFLFDDWKSGIVTLKNNEEYALDKINFDASKNKFFYYKNDTVFEFFDNVKQIKIFTTPTQASGGKGPAMIFRSDIDPESADLIQVLTAGKITVLQEIQKRAEGENHTNGITSTTRKYVLHTRQNAVVNNRIIPVKFTSSSLDELTSDKKTQVDAFVKENNLKVKKQDDFLKAVAFYNSISTLPAH